MRRREFLGVPVALAGLTNTPSARAKTPESSDLVQYELTLDGDKRIARRALVLAPNHVDKDVKLPVLVLLHGLGETGNELLGIHAWGERYGLVRAYERLRRRPVERTLPGQSYFTEEHLERVNAELKTKAFRGLVLVCPVTPNPQKVGPAAKTLDWYADWIEKTLLPAVYDKVSCKRDAASTGLDGCSLGGYVGMEVFLRKPERFGSFGTVQAAYSIPAAERYAERVAAALKRAGTRPVHVETSSEDPFRKANVAFAKKLEALGVARDLVVIPGPHNQPWLREVGTLELLLWHERKLA